MQRQQRALQARGTSEKPAGPGCSEVRSEGQAGLAGTCQPSKALGVCFRLVLWVELCFPIRYVESLAPRTLEYELIWK